MFVTTRDLGFGPVYSAPGPGGRILPEGQTVAYDVAGRAASRFAGVGQLPVEEDVDPMGINPWPGHSVYRDVMRGLGQNERFARPPVWGAAMVDIDRRPIVETGTSPELGGILDTLKSYALPVGIGAAAAVVLAVVLKVAKRGRRTNVLRSTRRTRLLRRRRRRMRRRSCR